jgi:hypothetical protein
MATIDQRVGKLSFTINDFNVVTSLTVAVFYKRLRDEWVGGEIEHPDHPGFSASREIEESLTVWDELSAAEQKAAQTLFTKLKALVEAVE